eukprot:7651240-Pyramimonas_sp.AAC.2
MDGQDDLRTRLLGSGRREDVQIARQLRRPGAPKNDACLNEYVSAYGLDAMRYYLLVQGPIGAMDANFSEQRLHE